MKLRAWLNSQGITAEQFALTVDASVHAVNAWCQGSRRPSKSKMPLVIKATGGAVQPNDFFGVGAAESSPPQPNPAAMAAILHMLGGHTHIAEGSGIPVTDLEAMERDGLVWSQHRAALVAFARAPGGHDLDADRLTFRPLGKDTPSWRAA